MSDLLKRTAILEAKDLPFEDVDVPEWGGTVRIAGMTGEAATAFSDEMVEMDSRGQVKSVKMENFMAKMLAMTIVDDDFKAVFSKEDIEALGKKSAAVLKRLSEVAMRLSGLGEGSIEGAQKN